MFSIRELTPESISRRPYISNIMQTVYNTPRISPPFRLFLLQASSFLWKMTASTRNARINLTARIFMGDMVFINIFEKRNDVPLATNTAVKSNFALIGFILCYHPMLQPFPAVKSSKEYDASDTPVCKHTNPHRHWSKV